MSGIEEHLLAQERMFNNIVSKFETKLLLATRDTNLVVFITGVFCGGCCVLLLLTLIKRKKMQSIFSRSTTPYQ